MLIYTGFEIVVRQDVMVLENATRSYHSTDAEGSEFIVLIINNLLKKTERQLEGKEESHTSNREILAPKKTGLRRLLWFCNPLVPFGNPL